MKKNLLFSLLLLSSGLCAQKNLSAPANTPEPDPSDLWDYAPPEIVCKNTLALQVDAQAGTTLAAWEAIQSVEDNATPGAQLEISMRRSGSGPGFPLDAQGNPVLQLDFYCFNLGTQTVEIWARDAAGNTASCETTLSVENLSGDCPPGSGSGLPVIQICAHTETVDGVEEITTSLTGSNPNEPFIIFDFENPLGGCDYFGVPAGSNVTVAPLKDDNPLNGVTTYDLLLISKHIQGIELLNSSYKMIAADADRNGVIDSADISEFHKLILGDYLELPNNTSWRFLPKEYVFPDPLNPFAENFPESITIQNILLNVNAEFIGIKIGDVNNTAVANAGQEPEERGIAPEISSAIIGSPYPNPSAGGMLNLSVYLDQAETVQMEISDLSGKLCLNKAWRLEKGMHSLNLETPEVLQTSEASRPGAGVYLWRVRAGASVKTGKLIRT